LSTALEPEAMTGPDTQIPDLSLIICTLNEGVAIRSVIEEICVALSGIRFEIIVVDDNSTDATHSEVRAVMAKDPRVNLHVRTNERGLSSAAIRGWDISKGRYLGVMDGDGQHDPVAIRALADMILKGDKDLVCVSRYLGESDTGLSFMRDLGSKAATFATGLVLKAPLTDPLSGCFMMSRAFYLSARPKLAGVGFKILVDVVASATIKPRFGEVKAALRQRQGGESKLDLRVVADLAALLVEKATGGFLPARFVLFAGVGVSGGVVNGIVLEIFRAVGYSTDREFGIAQLIAITVSMTWNFFVNNSLTFRDRRLKGLQVWRALFGFYLACTPGAILNFGIAIWLKMSNVDFVLAGIIPALLIGVLNYWASKYLSWGPSPSAKIVKAEPEADTLATVPEASRKI
jgi:dolichol-phosphate mannosyltransferase